ncbi:MAG: ABC transporter ATP-binding protein [Candidatus Eremiobacteraeota bacterium]|nr:ABC transporter ATP-binding protein [Candidatus Eremiobacteraeota bacterium]
MMMIKRAGDDERFSGQKPQLTRPVDARRIARLFLPYWRQELVVLTCIVAAAVLGLAPAVLSKHLIDVSLAHRSAPGLTTDVALMIGAALLAALCGVAQGYFNSVVGQGIMRDLRVKLVTHLFAMPISFFTGTKTGKIMNRVTSDVDNVESVVTVTLSSVLTNLTIILSAVAAMLAISWKLSIVALIVLPLMVAPLFPVGKRMYTVKKATREKRDEMQGITQEALSISGITLVKSFVRAAFESTRYARLADELMKAEISLAMVGRWFMGLISAMVTIGPAIVWLAGGYLFLRGEISIGTIVAFVALLARLYGPASQLIGVQVQIVSALAVFERIFEYLDFVREPSGTRELTGDVAGKIGFENVSFSYVPERPALRDVDLTIEPGQVAALVGPSGAGKTTLTHLVSRFYDPQSGRVTIDGADVKEFDVESLRSHIGIVTQETYLFHDTIEANLRYANENATHEEIEAAARAANLLSFIESLPDGFKTVVGERGHKLSGGERQRLAIARVLLKNPQILILDEATSSLDSENEALIQAAFEKVMRGRTSLVIAHRLSTIISADVIFVVDGGRIVESGKHADLLARDGAYAQLYRTQFKSGSAPVRAPEPEREAETVAPNGRPMMKMKMRPAG